MLNREVLTTEEFAERIVDMGCCKFDFNVQYSDVLFSLTKMNLGMSMLVVLLNEFQDRSDGKNYSMAFGIEGVSNNYGEGLVVNKDLAIQSVARGLNTYCETVGLGRDCWIWDEGMFSERDVVEVLYS